jgi:hypothetical protein
MASLDCSDAGTDVSYHTFDTAADLNSAYAQALHARGVSTGTGSCAQRWPAESSYADQFGSGRLACYVDRRGAWLMWTDSDALGIAFRSDSQMGVLYATWSSGAVRLRQ